MEDILKLVNSSRIVALVQERLADLKSGDLFGPSSIPFWEKFPNGDVAIILHALATAVFVRKLVSGRQHSWVLHALLFLFVNFAGNTVQNLLMGHAITWITADKVIGLAMVCWWLINCSPFDLIGKIALSGPVSFLLDALDATCRLNAIVAALNLVIKTHSSWFAVIFLGTTIGSSRALVADIYRLAVGDSTRSQLSAPKWPIKSAFYVTIAYVILTDPFNVVFEPTDPKPATAAVVAGLKLFLVAAQLLQPFLKGESVPPLNLVEMLVAYVTGLAASETRTSPKFVVAKAADVRSHTVVAPSPAKKDKKGGKQPAGQPGKR